MSRRETISKDHSNDKIIEFKTRVLPRLQKIEKF